MSTELVAIWLGAVLLFSIPIILIGAYMAHTSPLMEYLSDKFCNQLFRLGLSFGMIGLCVQTYRSFFYFYHGYYPADVYFPTWATKDIGFCMIVFSLFLQQMLNKKNKEEV